MSRKLLVPFQLPADPTLALEAATKQYVDLQNEVIVAAADPITTNPQAELWIDTVTNPPAAPLASAISFSPTGTIAATNVQSAVAEVANEAPRGLVAWKQGTYAGLALTATPTTFATLVVTLTVGRMYELIISCRAITSANNLYFSCAPSPAGGMPLVDDYVYAPTNYNSCYIHKILVPNATASYTFAIKANTGSGGGNMWNDQGGGVWINDLGLAIASQ